MIRSATCLPVLVALCVVNLKAAPPAAAPDSLALRKSGGDWPGFLGPRRDGKSAEQGLLAEWPAGGPRIVWQKTVGVGYAAPAIAGGRLFHFARFENAERLTCYNAETGDELWKHEYATDYEDLLGYNNGPRATPVVDEGFVFTYGADGILQCVRVADGEPVWKVDTFREFGVVKNFFGVGSTPLVWRDLLIVHVGGSPAGGPADVYSANGAVDSNGTAVIAFEKATGKVRWKTGDELASYASPIVATVEGKEVLFMFARGGLMAIDPAKGETITEFPWRARKLESVNASTPIVLGNEVFISETYELGSALVRYSGGKFEEVWSDRGRRRNQSMALHWNTPIEHKGFLYGSSGYHAPDAELRCIDWKTGEVKWSEPNMGRSSLLLVEDKLIALAEDGTVRVVRATPERYEEMAKWELAGADRAPLLGSPAWAAPALSRGLLYVQGGDRLVSLELIAEK